MPSCPSVHLLLTDGWTSRCDHALWRSAQREDVCHCRAGSDTCTTSCTSPALTAQPGPVVGDGRRFTSLPRVLCTTQPSTTSTFARTRGTNAGCQLHSTSLIQDLAVLREWGTAGPWAQASGSSGEGKGPAAFLDLQSLGSCSVLGGAVGLMPSIPSQEPVLCVLQSSELSSTRQCGVWSTRHKGGSRARGGRAFQFGFLCKCG